MSQNKLAEDWSPWDDSTAHRVMRKPEPVEGYLRMMVWRRDGRGHNCRYCDFLTTDCPKGHNKNTGKMDLLCVDPEDWTSFYFIKDTPSNRVAKTANLLEIDDHEGWKIAQQRDPLAWVPKGFEE